MAVDVVRGQRLLEPTDVGGFVEARAADRLVDREGLIGVDEDLEVGPDGRSRAPASRATSSSAGRPTLIFDPPKPCGLGLQRVRDERFGVGRCSQPPSVV